MLGIRGILTELQEAYNRLSSTDIDALRYLGLRKKKVISLETILLKIGCGHQISLVTFSNNQVYFPTHDDGEIKYLMKRDYQGIEEYHTEKIFTGVLKST